MQFAVMNPADRNCELVAHSASECTRLCKGEVMRIRRHAAEHKARLPQENPEVVLIAQANRFAQSTHWAAASPFLGQLGSFLARACVSPAGGYRALVRDSTRRPARG